ncbi:MAG: hypothetical protein WAO52_19740 [Prolixibacteraceae bacterium]
MKKESDISIQLLKEEIQNKVGQRILYASDCQYLSHQILKYTKRMVSVSTLKRVFGVIQNSFNPSKYTLDTLAIYLDYPDWQAYRLTYENERGNFVTDEAWNNLKAEARLITDASMKSLKNKIGTRYKDFPVRKFAKRNFQQFLSSHKIATALIAPEGLGKSTNIVQLVDKYFYNPNPEFQDDIVCLVDGSIFYHLLAQDQTQNIKQLNNLIEFNPVKSYQAIFRHRQELVKGRYVMIIEDVDNVHPESEKLEYFVDNLLLFISSFENVNWIKVLITCSPNLWRKFLYRMKKNHLHKSLWFNVSFHGTDEEFVNIPFLSKKEINAVLKRNHFPDKIHNLCFKDPEMLELLKIPNLLFLFLSTYAQNGKTSEIELLNQYIIKTVLSEPYPDEKFGLVKSFFSLCDYGKKGIEVKRDELHISVSQNLAYRDLIRAGFFSEFSVIDTYLTMSTYVKFSNENLFAFYLANFLVRENGLTLDLMKQVIQDNYTSLILQRNLLKYLIKILFRKEEIGLLQHIFSVIAPENLPPDPAMQNVINYAVANSVALELRKSKNMRDALIPGFAQSETARKLYFEQYFDLDSLVLNSGDEIDYYQEFVQSEEATQYVRYMKFMKYFLSENAEQCKVEYEKYARLDNLISRNSLKTSFYFIPQILYQSKNGQGEISDITEAVYRVSEHLLKEGIQKRTQIPQLEFAVIFSYNYAKMYREIKEMTSYIFDNYDFSELKSSCFYQLFLSVYAKALYELGEESEAFEIYEQVQFDKTSIPPNMRCFVVIRFLLVKAQFQIYLKKLKKAKKTLQKIKEIAEMLRFSYFFNKALEMEGSIESSTLESA